jgi:DNA-binding MarR family transcriptional regulator
VADDKDIHSIQLLGELDQLVHEPARLVILANLYAIKHSDFIYLMRQTGLTRGNLSSHMSKLEAAGYIEVKKEFVDKIPRTLLSLTPKGRRAFQAYRQKMIQGLGELPD